MQTLSDATPPIDKSHPFRKSTIIFSINHSTLKSVKNYIALNLCNIVYFINGSLSQTPFNYLFGDKELLARQVGLVGVVKPQGHKGSQGKLIIQGCVCRAALGYSRVC